MPVSQANWSSKNYFQSISVFRKTNQTTSSNLMFKPTEKAGGWRIYFGLGFLNWSLLYIPSKDWDKFEIILLPVQVKVYMHQEIHHGGGSFFSLYLLRFHEIRLQWGSRWPTMGSNFLSICTLFWKNQVGKNQVQQTGFLVYFELDF